MANKFITDLNVYNETLLVENFNFGVDTGAYYQRRVLWTLNRVPFEGGGHKTAFHSIPVALQMT